MVEELQRARNRGATIWGEIVGFGSSAVVDRDGVPHLDRALQNVITQALRKAGMTIDDIGHIHAHGLSTHKSDREEAAGIHAVFGGRRGARAGDRLKSYLGNLGAGGGVVELGASLLALHFGKLFPILNFTTPDPDCPVAAVRGYDTPPGDSVLKVSVTPQGQAAAIIVRRCI